MKLLRFCSFVLVLVLLLPMIPCSFLAEAEETSAEISVYGLQTKYHNGNLAVRFLVLSDQKEFDRVGMKITVKDSNGEPLREKICYSNTALSSVKQKIDGKTIFLNASDLGGDYLFALAIDNLPITGLFSISAECFYDKNGERVDFETCYIELQDRAYLGGVKNGGMALSLLEEYATTAMTRLCNVFWNAKEGHFLRTHGGNPNSWTPDIWENAQSLLALADLYEATNDVTYYQMIESQWNFLKTDTGKEIMTGASNLDNVPYWAQDDCAWGALELMAFYRILGDETALEWAHDLIVNTYNHWGTGEIIDYDGVKIKDCSDGIYYTFHEEYDFQSVFGIPMCVAALEYCQAKCPNNPSSVDIYDASLNIFLWTETNMCRTKSVTYKDYDKDGDCTVRYVDNLYYVDYHRYGENGPTNARIATQNSSTCLFSNMAMAVCAVQLYEITKDASYKDIAVRTAKAITKYETYKDSGCYITERDMSVSTSMLGYFVKKVLTLPEVTIKEKNTLFTTAKFVGEKCQVPSTNFYYVQWNSHYTDYVGSFDDLTQNAYECQPVFASIVHLLTGALLYKTLLK